MNDIDYYEDLHKSLDNQIMKYKENPYMLNKIVNHITKVFPQVLENFNEQNIIREERKNQLSCNQSEFTERFMHKNKYYYCSNNELFLLYDNIHFTAYSENNILHQILTTITEEQNLVPWKHKIKVNIIKRIKEQSPLKAIPESATIQSVINNLYPTYLPSKNYAKYFLTIIGDYILEKNLHLIYIISDDLKELLREISNLCYNYFGLSNVFSGIKYKYYDHDYDKCRLLNITHHNKITNVNPYISKYIIDLLCVATHYSLRYQNADGFLEQCNDTKLINNALYLRNKTPNQIVDDFINTSIQKCQGTSIKDKNMVFLWKKYLEQNNLPNIIFFGTLKSYFRNKLSYNETLDTYQDITSINLPVVSNFIEFWDTTISEDVIESEIEIDELTKIFKNWKIEKNQNIDEDFLLDLIKHFYPEIGIEDNKYILNIKCSLWNKREEVINSLEIFKLSYKGQSDKSIQSINKIYQNYADINKGKWIVSKRYYEKVAREILEDLIDNHGLINNKWYDD